MSRERERERERERTNRWNYTGERERESERRFVDLAEGIRESGAFLEVREISTESHGIDATRSTREM